MNEEIKDALMVAFRLCLKAEQNRLAELVMMVSGIGYEGEERILEMHDAMRKVYLAKVEVQ